MISTKAPLLGQAHLVQCRASQTFPCMPSHLFDSVPGQDAPSNTAVHLHDTGLSLVSSSHPGYWAWFVLTLFAQLCSVLCRHSLKCPSQDSYSLKCAQVRLGFVLKSEKQWLKLVLGSSSVKLSHELRVFDWPSLLDLTEGLPGTFSSFSLSLWLLRQENQVQPPTLCFLILFLIGSIELLGSTTKN